MVRLKDLSKSFSNKKLFNNFNLDIHQGDKIVITGPNGSGKTTLLRILKGLIIPDSGNIIYKNKEIKNQITFVSKNHLSFFMRLTLDQNLKFFYHLCANEDKFSLDKLYQFVSIFHLTEFLNLEFSSLSSGQAQKASIIRGLFKNTELIMFDESLNSLDKDSKKTITNTLQKELRNKSVLWVTHDKDEIDFENTKYLEL